LVWGYTDRRCAAGPAAVCQQQRDQDRRSVPVLRSDWGCYDADALVLLDLLELVLGHEVAQVYAYRLGRRRHHTLER